MAFSCFYRHFGQNPGVSPSRLVYQERAPDTVSGDSAVEARREKVLENADRSARYTRRQLFDKGFTAKDGSPEGGVSYDKLGLRLANTEEFRDDRKLANAVFEMQRLHFPDSPDEWDGFYGPKTYAKRLEKASEVDKQLLKARIEQVRTEQEQREGPDVAHVMQAVQADTPDYVKTALTDSGISKDVIEAAQNESRSTAAIEALAQRPNYLKVVKYAARVADVPPALIIATTWAEMGGKFSKKDYGADGELGMGHFMPAYWRSDYTTQDKFYEAMRMVTDKDRSAITDIGRARSIVADLVAIGIKLAETKDRLKINFSYDTDVSQMSEDDLMKIRFHYYAPGFSGVLWMPGRENAHGSRYYANAQREYKDVENNLRTRFAQKAKDAHNQLKG